MRVQDTGRREDHAKMRTAAPSQQLKQPLQATNPCLVKLTAEAGSAC